MSTLNCCINSFIATVPLESAITIINMFIAQATEANFMGVSSLAHSCKMEP